MKTVIPSTDSRIPIGEILVASWVLRVLVAIVFIYAGANKLAGTETMIGFFQMIGVGQWFRYLTGLVEVIGAVTLLIPATAAFSALILTVTMVGAIATHLVVGGSLVFAAVLMVITGLITWLHRASVTRLLKRPLSK